MTKPLRERLCDDLAELRRGHGLLDADMPARAGRDIRFHCGVSDNDNDAAVRQKIQAHLSSLSARLPFEQRVSVQAALALAPAAQHRFLHERMKWAAGEIDRWAQRTAERHTKNGLRVLAELLEDNPATAAPRQRDWYTVRLQATVRMDQDPPELIETRTIVALVEDLDEIVAEISAPPKGDIPLVNQTRAQVSEGGEIVEEDHSSRGYTRFTIRLPRPLAAGEQHTYRVSFTSLPRELMRPYYVMTPYRRCDDLQITVRFLPTSPPTQVWRLDAAPTRKVDDFQPSVTTLALEPDSQVTVSFKDLQQGLSYGLQWQNADPVEGQSIAL